MASLRKTIAVTGVTGTVGRALLGLLDDDRSVRRVIGIGSRGWDPAAEQPAKLDYRQVDVRDRYATRAALEGADVVIHLAFAIYGLRQDAETLEAINVRGSINVLDGALAGGAERFIYTSSAAVYGFGEQRPERVTEDAPVDPEARHFYSRHKAAVESALLERFAGHPEIRWVMFRPCAIVGPDAAGAATHALPGAVARSLSVLVSVGAGAGLRPPVPGPPVALQFVHARDVAQAIHRAITTHRTGAIYNLGGEGLVDPAQVPELLGLRRLPLPRFVSRAAVDLAAKLPYVPPGVGWLQLATRPLEVDSTRARRELGWRPEFDSHEALAATRRALAI